MSKDIYFGYIYFDGRYDQAIRLDSKKAIQDFLMRNLFAEELRICDAGDRLLLHVQSGIDLFNDLDTIGIDLSSIYQSLRRDALQSHEGVKPKETWKILYDQIGFSPGEITMRQRVKSAAVTAQAVADVAKLLAVTYFAYARNI